MKFCCVYHNVDFLFLLLHKQIIITKYKYKLKSILKSILHTFIYLFGLFYNVLPLRNFTLFIFFLLNNLIRSFHHLNKIGLMQQLAQMLKFSSLHWTDLLIFVFK